MDCNGFWIWDDNNYSWLYIGISANEAMITMRREHSHDVQLWIYFNEKKWMVCDGADPLDPGRVVKMKLWAHHNLK